MDTLRHGQPLRSASNAYLRKFSLQSAERNLMAYKTYVKVTFVPSYLRTLLRTKVWNIFVEGNLRSLDRKISFLGAPGAACFRMYIGSGPAACSCLFSKP